MKRIGYLLFITLWTSIVFGQEIDSLGINNNPLLNIHESSFLESQFESELFDFKDKRIAFYKSLSGIQSKQEFFIDSREHIISGHKLPLQTIVLNSEEKFETGGFDIIIVSWSKKQVTPKIKEKILKELIKAST